MNHLLHGPKEDIPEYKKCPECNGAAAICDECNGTGEVEIDPEEEALNEVLQQADREYEQKYDK